MHLALSLVGNILTESRSLGVFQLLNSIDLLDSLAIFAQDIKHNPALISFLANDGLLEWLLSLLS